MDEQMVLKLIADNLNAQAEIQRLQQREMTLERICKQAIDELENSKKRLSRELHDELGQAMTSILLQLKMLQHEENVEVIHDRLGGLRYLTQQTIEDVRRLAMNLRPTVLENLGLISALEWYIEDYRRYSGIKVTLVSPRLKKRLPSEVETVVYRAVQESLTNVARHAEASLITIRVNFCEHGLELYIGDNGKGMSCGDLKRGLGLLGMEERVRLAGGDFKIKSRLGQGTEITITLPLKDEGGEMNEP
ncbi:histidine kinase [Desulfitobacterium dichloroeliminans LMG P-21439]|uniref:Oxygen sensor histidine kinase NreB n=1 Tax=Desulfitobacterium dichloroeliminans (strain LMG P-21439 / DCA1) TaxID=871963 RepID=L0FBM0_DESDL|nr:sensor histidine kinase [Desulfitobacterium dichloroeliminans]AGA70348.1 histidine kinase [Desulfitobacterium dichloroeliminans LMG P-21439]